MKDSPRSGDAGDFARPPRSADLPARAALTGGEIAAAASRLRTALPCDPIRVAAALGETCKLWRNRDFTARRRAVSLIAERRGHSIPLLDESLDALLKPFSRAALESFAKSVSARGDLMGFIMAGNVPGAGLHEICMALIAGAALIIKTASTEPVFFSGFLETLGATDGEVAARAALFNWERGRTDLTKALSENCDYLVAFGDDATLARLGGRRLFGFGSRLSGVLVTREALLSPGSEELAGALARDVTLFEQQGCLSPHHVFVEDPTTDLARRFSGQLAEGLERLAVQLRPPAGLAPDAAVQIRHARDAARWRRLGGEDVELWEGAGLGWTVIYDSAAGFRASPGYRTVYVTPVNDLGDFRARLEPAAGHLEALAVADPAGRTEAIRHSLRRLGISYLCAPGEMQSPPLAWPHGDGALFEMFQNERRRA